MTSRDSIRAALVEAEARLGTVQILINNAGIPDAERAIKMSDELTDAVFDTNLIGPWFCLARSLGDSLSKRCRVASSTLHRLRRSTYQAP